MLFANINAVALAKSAGTNPWGGGSNTDHLVTIKYLFVPHVERGGQ